MNMYGAFDVFGMQPSMYTKNMPGSADIRRKVILLDIPKDASDVANKGALQKH